MEVNFVGNLYKRGAASELTYALQATVNSKPHSLCIFKVD